MLRKAWKKKRNTTLERFQKDSLDRDSLTKIGWDENITFVYDEIAKEDHSYTATRGERGRNENSWRLFLIAEGANGPLDQRDDCKEAKEDVPQAVTGRMQQLQDAETQRYIHNKSEGPTSNSKGTKRIRIDLIHQLSGHILFPRQGFFLLLLRHPGGNRPTAGGQHVME